MKMSLTQVAIMAVFITVSTAAITRNDPIREHPHSVVVTEGGTLHMCYQTPWNDTVEDWRL